MRKTILVLFLAVVAGAAASDEPLGFVKIGSYGKKKKCTSLSC
jgi:hypothetical protein